MKTEKGVVEEPIQIEKWKLKIEKHYAMYSEQWTLQEGGVKVTSYKLHAYAFGYWESYIV